MAIEESFNIYIINYWMLIVAGAILIILSFLEKRTSRHDLCYGRPALLIPFRFLDGYENRTAYAMAFGTASSTVVSLVISERTLGFDLPLWATALYVYLQAIIACLTCYPLFACLTTRYRAVGAILCILYSALWLSLNTVQLIQTLEQFPNSNTSVQRNNTIALNTFKVYYVLQGLPELICYLVLILYSFYILHRCYLTKTLFNKRMEGTVKLHQEEHVKWVLRKYKIKNLKTINELDDSQTFLDRMDKSFKLRYFTNFPFFKYPARMVALYFVQLTILYWAGILLMMITLNLLLPIIYAEFTLKYVEPYVVDLTVILSVSAVTAFFVCVLNALAQIFIGARNYRLDMLKIFQRKGTFLNVSNISPQNILTRNMTFPGYQMAFMLWGIILCFVTVFLLTLIPVLVFYFTAKFNVLADLLLALIQLLSFPVCVFALFYLQVFMAKKVLLQEKLRVTDEAPPLNVDNRKFYEIINYTLMFTNMTVGLFTCMFRIIQSAFFGIFAIARLDRSVFPHDLESWDRGYAAYISMLLVDNAHNNPCMRVFAHLLWTKVMSTRLRQVQSQSESNASEAVSNHRPRQRTYGTDNVVHSPVLTHHPDHPWTIIEASEIRRTSRSRKRWFLVYTLINNPQFCKLRKHKLTRNSISDKKSYSSNSHEGASGSKAEDDPVLIDVTDSFSSTHNETNDHVLLISMLHDSTSSA